MVKNKLKYLDGIDNGLYNFLGILVEVYETIADETANTTYFTENYNTQLLQMVRKIILNTECGNLHTEAD